MSRARVLPRLLALATRDRRAFALALALVLLAAAAEVGGPLLIRAFIDTHVQTGNYPLAPVLLLAGAYALLQCVAAVAGYAQGVQLARIALEAMMRLREQAFATALRLPVAWFDRTPVGAVVSRLTNDTEAVKDFYVNVLGVVVANGARVLGMAAAMLVLDWRLAIPCLAFLPAALLVMWTYQRLSGARFRRVRQALATINGTLSESIGGVRAIQLTRQARRFDERFAAQCGEHYRARMASLRLDAMMLRPLVDVLLMVCMAALVLWFGSEALAGALEIGVIYVFVNYLARLAEPVIDVAHRLSMFQSAMVSAARVFELVDRDDVAAPRRGGPLPRDTRLCADGVGFAYPEGRRCCTTSVSSWRPGVRWRWSAPPAAARAPSRGCCCVSIGRSPVRSRSAGCRSRRSTTGPSAAWSPTCRRTRSCSPAASRRTSTSGSARARNASRRWRVAPGWVPSWTDWSTGWTPPSASVARPCRPGSASR